MDVRLAPSSSRDDAAVSVPNNLACPVCKKATAKYSCPKCRVMYCSVPCYQTHGNACVELFYKQNVVETLKSSAAPDKDKLEMMRILQRVAEQEARAGDPAERADDALDEVPWEALLARVERGEDVLAELPEAVRADFARALDDGRLSSALDDWEPWWMASARVSALPAPVLPLASLASLTRGGTPPSPLLAYGVVDLLFTYAIVMRLYQGEWRADAGGAAAAALRLSGVLGGKQPHASTASALLAVAERAVRSSLLPRGAAVALMADVPRLLARHDYALAALGELHAITAAGSAGSPEERKMFFHLVWLHSMPAAVCAPLLAEAEAVQLEHASAVQLEHASAVRASAVRVEASQRASS